MSNFKIGDWVEVRYATGTRIVAIISSEKTVQENGIGKHYETDINTWNKWQPEVGEWCWFKTCNCGFELGQYVTTLSSGQYRYKLNSTNSLFNCSYCEPFIGELPNF